MNQPIPIKYFSAFSGIGGFELGLQLAYDDLSVAERQEQGRVSYGSTNSEQFKLAKQQLTCVGFSEIDKYATQIYLHHFPTHKNYGDITKINEKELPDFELLVGGFPCQAFSIAGKRRGFEDTRGTMFFELARILKAKQPRLFLFENVKGLLSHNSGETFKVIIQTLTELGYDLQWQVLNSKNHGVPQNRERVFIIGHLRGTCRPEILPIRINKQKDSQCGIYTGTLTSRYAASQREGTYIEENGNKEGKIRQLNTPNHSNDRVYDIDGISPTLNTMQGGNRQPKIYDDYNSKWRNDKRIWEHDILSSPGWGCDGTVVWEDGGFTLDNGETSDVIGYQIKLHLYEYPESIITVVCSTFDHPELLSPYHTQSNE